MPLNSLSIPLSFELGCCKTSLQNSTVGCESYPCGVQHRNVNERRCERDTVIASICTSMSESRGGTGSLARFLPLSFPSELRLAGAPSCSFPGVGGLVGAWYSAVGHTHVMTCHIHRDMHLKYLNTKANSL